MTFVQRRDFTAHSPAEHGIIRGAEYTDKMHVYLYPEVGHFVICLTIPGTDLRCLGDFTPFFSSNDLQI